MAFADRLAFENELQDSDGQTRRADKGPTEKQRLGRLTIAFFILNRTIGSGIFIKPGVMVKLTGSIGITLVLWLVGGIFALCGTCIWLEFSLSTPRHIVQGEEVSVPRNGGEKNFLEFVYRTPERLATCMYGIAFIILGNVAANSYAFATYVMEAATGAAYVDHQKPTVIGIAIATLSLTVLFLMFTRSGGIWLNNFLAVLKVGFLLAIIVLGIMKAAGVDLGGTPDSLDNFDSSFATVGDITPTGVASALTAAIYSFSGFLQPFYVLSEFRRPRSRFPRYTLSTICLVIILYLMVNVSYFMVVEKSIIVHSNQNIATLFLEHVYGNEKAFRAMSALVAISILGNIVVMTYTAARVKQEVAKEGILPFSLFWAIGHTSPAARISKWYQRNVRHRAPGRDPGHDASQDLDHQEQTPAAAFLLHWFFTVLLIAVTVQMTPGNAYELLTNLYTYVIRILVGFFVSLGLIILKLSPSRDWKTKSHYGYIPTWLSIIPALVFCCICAFLIVMPFVQPSSLPSYSPWYLIPVIGITAPFWGVAWWLSLQLYMKVRHRTLKVTRVPYVIPEAGSQGNYLQAAELVDYEWSSSVAERRVGADYGKVAYTEVYDLGTRNRNSP